MYPLLAIVDGTNQIVPIAVQCIMNHLSGMNRNVPVTLHHGWLESERARYSA